MAYDRKLADQRYRENNKAKVKESNQIYNEKMKDVIAEKKKVYNQVNKEKNKEVREKRYIANPNKRNEYYLKNKETIRQKAKERYQRNKKEINKKILERQKNDMLFAITCKIRKNIIKTLRERGYTKKSKTRDILGCTFDEFKQHLESQFQPWMNWQNRGLYNGTLNYGWDIDHIVPLSTATCEEDIIHLNHYTNLQPLCSYINRYVKKDNLTIM